MAAKCGKCDPHEICEECPEWIFTLADLIMCMMGLFVLLWVLKPAPNPPAAQGAPQSDEWIKTAAAIRDAFGYIPDPTKSPEDRVNSYMLLKKLQEMNPDLGPGKGGETIKKPDGAKGTDTDVTTIRPGSQAIVGGRLQFEVGSAELGPELTTQLQGIAKQIRGYRIIVLVKGHTSLDDFPDGTSPDKKMDLSLRRAQAAADALVALGVQPDILRVQGCSTFEPVAQRAYTAAGQSVNRRVEIEATSTLVTDRQDPAAKASAPAAPAAPSGHTD
jgi:flagellar motor protein MotB